MNGGERPFLAPRFRPRPLEIACGLTLGADPEASPLTARDGTNPRTALDQAVRRALAHPPCLVSFSGGRDSSAVLALAAAIARQEGYALPVPATYRFVDAPGSEEADWQEQVIAHLSLDDWEKVPIAAELDSVGPVAQAMLRRHGLLWPFNAHFHVPLMERARGGSLLTGIGGDELLGPQLWSSAWAVLTGRRPPRLADVRTVGLALAPRPLRRHKLAGRRRIHWPWLQPEANESVNRQTDDWRSRAPLRWNRGVGRWWQSRYHTVLSATMTALAADAGTQILHPFLEETVVAAAAHRFGPRGPADRSSAMQALFGDVLPEPILTRRSKAFFDRAFFSDHSRSFVAQWTGHGVDTRLVNPERLAQAWQANQPDPRSFLLIQAAWHQTR